MKAARFDALTDGMFAIIMTLLVIEIRVPELHGIVTNEKLFEGLIELWPLFISYLLAFMVLFSYWLVHHFIVSLFAKNLSRNFVYLNIPFLATVALIPFSSHFLGLYNDYQAGVLVFGINIAIGSILLWKILKHAIHSPEIENDLERFTQKDMHYAQIRILLPAFGAAVAIPVSYLSPTISIFIFVGITVFNFIPGTLIGAERMIGRFLSKAGLKEAEEVE